MYVQLNQILVMKNMCIGMVEVDEWISYYVKVYVQHMTDEYRKGWINVKV